MEAVELSSSKLPLPSLLHSETQVLSSGCESKKSSHLTPPRSEPSTPRRGDLKPVVLRSPFSEAAIPPISSSLGTELHTSTLTPSKSQMASSPSLHLPTSESHTSKAISTVLYPILPQTWSQYECDQFLAKLQIINVASGPGLEPAFTERAFELISRELGHEEIEKTPQECQEFYDELVKKGSIAKKVEEKQRMAKLFDRHLTELFDKDIGASDDQEPEGPPRNENRDAAEDKRDIKAEPTLHEKDKINMGKPYRRSHLWSVEEERCLCKEYKEYKALFENSKSDKHPPREQWETIARNLEAQGFARRTKAAYITRWKNKRDYYTKNGRLNPFRLVFVIKKEYEDQHAPRFTLTEAQEDELEVEYKVNEYPDSETEATLAKGVGLSIDVVKEWFERRGRRRSTSSSRKKGSSRGRRPTKRQRRMSPHNKKSYSLSPAPLSQTNHIAPSTENQLIKSSETAIPNPPTPSSDPDIDFSTKFADLKMQERQRLEVKYEEYQGKVQEIGDDIRKHESDARRSLLAVQKGKRRMDGEVRKLEKLRRNIESLDLIF